MAVEFATPPVWERDRLKLERALYIFMAVWIGGALIAVVGGFVENNVVFVTGAVVFLLSVFPYVVTLSRAYRLQEKLNEAGGVRAGASWVVFGGLILNPWIVGVIIPALVLRAERKARESSRNEQLERREL